MKRTDLWTQWGKERAGQIEKAALTYIYHHMLHIYICMIYILYIYYG